MDDLLHCQSVPSTEPRWPSSSGFAKIKKESFEPELSLIYPHDNSSYSSHVQSRTPPLSFTNHARPLSSTSRGPLSNSDSIAMAGGTASSWSPNSTLRMGRSNTPAQRSRSGNEYSMNPPFMAASLPSHQPVFGLHLDPQDGSYGMRSATGSSALTSSLSGAIDDTAHRNSRSPPARHDSLFHSSNNWATSQSVMLQAMPPHSTFPGVSGIPLPYEMSANSLGYESATMRDSSPDSNSSGSSNFGSAMFDPYAQQHSMRHNVPPYNAMATQPPHQSVSIEEQFKTELVSLRQKLREAEAETARYRVALEELRAREAAPKTLLQTVPTSAAFQEDWNARTEIRKKMFCSLNRAGNALCAWHDSRRERRSFPPRNAPPGYLNCGCTHEEALFEESLARHQVGSYYPGESVRMDPALRNPLLKLLQQRYGYKDGDFDRNPVTGEWSNGDNAAYWEAQAHAGSSSRRRVEADRH